MKEIPFFKSFTLNEKKTMAPIEGHIVEYKKGEHYTAGRKELYHFCASQG